VRQEKKWIYVQAYKTGSKSSLDEQKLIQIGTEMHVCKVLTNRGACLAENHHQLSKSSD
jgi:hypothetical protein